MQKKENNVLVINRSDTVLVANYGARTYKMAPKMPVFIPETLFKDIQAQNVDRKTGKPSLEQATQEDVLEAQKKFEQNTRYSDNMKQPSGVDTVLHETVDAVFSTKDQEFVKRLVNTITSKATLMAIVAKANQLEKDKLAQFVLNRIEHLSGV